MRSTTAGDTAQWSHDGEFVVLVGPSGCGKSTLLRMLAGLEEIDSGSIAIDDRVVNDVESKDRDIAMVFQSYALYPHMTVRDNMAFSLKLRKAGQEVIDERVMRAAGILNLVPYLGRYPRELSGGQRQRVAMGRAIVRDPKVFLFDEPLSNLDAKLRVDMRTEIKKLHQQVGKTTIYVTHDQVEAMTLASRIAVMHKGSLKQYDEPQTIYDRPSNLFVAGFMGSPSMNFLPGRIEDKAGRAHVTLNCGTEAPLSLPLARPLSGRADGDVVLGVRPEHIVSLRSGADLPAGHAKVLAQVEVVEPTGSDTHVVLRLGAKEIGARFVPKDAPKTGQIVALGFDMNQACLFDAASERLIS